MVAVQRARALMLCRVLCWLLVSCAAALRVPVGSPRLLWQLCVFREPVAVLLHTTDLTRSAGALRRVLESGRYPFDAVYLQGCRAHMSRRRYGEIAALGEGGRWAALLAPPDCLASAPGALPLDGPALPTSVLLAGVPAGQALTDAEVAGEVARILALPPGPLTSCRWVARMAAGWEDYPRAVQVEAFERLHPSCLEEALAAGDPGYMQGLAHVIAGQRSDVPAGASAEGHYARLVLRLGLLYCVAQAAGLGGGARAPGVLRHMLESKLLDVQRALQALADAVGGGWAPRLLGLLGAVVGGGDDDAALPGARAVMASCMRLDEARDLGSVWPTHWTLQVVWLYHWLEGRLAGSLRPYLYVGLDMPEVWALDMVLAYRLARASTPALAQPARELRELAGRRDAGWLRQAVLGQAAERYAAAPFDRAMLDTVPVAERLRFLRAQHGLFWQAQARGAPRLQRLVRSAHAQQRGQPAVLVRGLFAGLEQAGVLRPEVGGVYAVRFADGYAMHTLGAMLALALLFGVRLPGRLEPGALGVAGGYAEPRSAGYEGAVQARQQLLGMVPALRVLRLGELQQQLQPGGG